MGNVILNIMSANMSIDELVAVNSLLIQRETCLADLSHIESTISDILGEPFPFDPPPVELPSTKKGKRAKAAKKVKPKKPKKIRRLKEGESAYRVTLSENGETETHILLDFSPFQDLVDNPLPHHRILTIETIDIEEEQVELLLET